MTQKFVFSPAAFRQRYLPWLMLFMTPSLVVDLLVLYRVVMKHPVILKDSGQLDFLLILAVILTNTFLLKSWAVIWYLIIRTIYRHSYVKCTRKSWLYRRKRIVLSEDHSCDIDYSNYRWNQLSKVTRKGTSIHLYGEIEQQRFDHQGILDSTALTHHICIPACFTDMEALFEKLQTMVVDQVGEYLGD